MTIDYDRLREQVEDFDQAESHHAKWVALEALRAHAAPMARELLLLRDGVEQLREMCLLERDAAFQETPMRAGEVGAFNVCADQLTRLLNGDTNEH